MRVYEERVPLAGPAVVRPEARPRDDTDHSPTTAAPAARSRCSGFRLNCSFGAKVRIAAYGGLVAIGVANANLASVSPTRHGQFGIRC